MRICQISDIHWRGIARHAEYTDSFERLFEKLATQIKPDLIINTGDTFHTKTQGITPEIIDKLSWMFRGLADIAPTIHILGNHDGNLTNSSRQDVITPIHDAVKHRHSFLFKASGTHKLCNLRDVSSTLFMGDDVYLHVFSPFDRKGWGSIKPVQGKINIALFHGSVAGSSTDANFNLLESDVSVDFFSGHDFVLLGDIHKQQVIATRPSITGEKKPWIAYPGSLIQQNFGEAPNKGFLVWDIESRDRWNCEFVSLENKAPFLTIPWCGDVGATLKEAHRTSPAGQLLPGTRVRVTSSQPIHQIETSQLLNELKTHCGVSEVIFKYNSVTNLELIDASGRKLLKTDLRHDAEALKNLFEEYLQAQKNVHALDADQKRIAKGEIEKYLGRFNAEEIEQQLSRNNVWSIKRLKFDNIFRYGTDNSIDFESLNGIVGIFGPNKTGKSSTIGALMYGLFNTTDRGPLKGAHIINRNKKFCSAEVEFTTGNSDYLIVRETVRNIPKKNPKKEDYEKTVTTLSLYRLLPDGRRQEMNSVSKDDTDKEIRKLIGSPQDFLLTALSNQGGTGRFIDEGASQRKTILNKFLDLDIFERLFTYAKEDFALLNEKTKKYNQTDWAEAISRTDKEISDLEERSAAIQTKLSLLGASKNEINLWLMQHSKASVDGLESLKQLKPQITSKEKHVTALIKQESQLRDELGSLVLEKRKILEEREKHDVALLRQQLDMLEKHRVQLQQVKHEHTIQNNLLKHQTQSVKKLNVVPCGDQFPTCQFIKDSHEDKKLIEAQTTLVNELASSIQQIDGVIQEFISRNITELAARLAEDERREIDLSHKINLGTSRLATISKNLEDGRQELAELERRAAEIESKISMDETKELEQKQLSLEVLKEQEKELEQEYRKLLVQLGGKTEQRRRITQERAECKQDLEMLKVHNSIQDAFSKNGIPAMILKTQLPAINEELAKILDGFADFKITLETDINSNAMDVYIEDAHSRRLIELASGMEKMISSLALRVALINLSNLPRSDMFIVDEGWGTLDSENLQKVASFLSGLRAYFKTILVISHIQEVKEATDTILEIKNDEIESHIKYPAS